jgi:hypothetical protein
MPNPLQEWTVFEHGPIDELEDNLWRVEAVLPGTPMKRVMTIARLKDKRLVVHSAVALNAESMKAIEAWGAPSFLVVPNAMHRLDAKVWKDRYPSMKVVCPSGARTEAAEVVAVDATEMDFGDDSVRWSTFPGTADREGVLTVRSGDRTTLVIADVVMNIRKIPGFGGFIMKMMGFVGPTPKVVRAAKKKLVADASAVRTQIEALASTKGLARVVFGHGEVLTSSAGEGLRQAIDTL